MKRCALISENRVQQIIVVGDDYEPSAACVVLPTDSRAAVGHIFDGASFFPEIVETVDPEPSVEERIAALEAALAAARAEQ